MTYSDRELRDVFPFISWREPTHLRVAGEPEGRLGCRLCIARLGLRASEVHTDLTGKISKTREQFDAHMKAIHPEEEM